MLSLDSSCSSYAHIGRNKLCLCALCELLMCVYCILCELLICVYIAQFVSAVGMSPVSCCCACRERVTVLQL